MPLSSDRSRSRVHIDQQDRRILEFLMANARVSFQDIAQELGVSRATVHERVKKLTQLGVIQGYHAAINWSLLGYPVTALIALQTEQGQASYSVLEDLAKIREVESAYLVAGRFDCIVKVRAESHEHLQVVLFDLIGKIRGFHRAETMVVLTTPLENHLTLTPTD
ncbi:MAG: Lrp/AsnC family transcriptional regulator [Firmicutes bacterium]|nr:Lrp/AsnC family transcriptional regulator [Bacillota bacterium]